METERLILKLYEETDGKDFIELSCDPVVMKFVDRGVLTREQAENLWRKLIDDFYPRGIDTLFAIFAREDSRYIGHAAIRPRPEKPEDWEISYILRREEWNKGFATEIAKRLIEYGFEELDLGEVFATVKAENKNSIRVMEKAGMSLLGEEIDGDERTFVYSIKK